MRRKRRGQPESMELLLDVLCCAFGGIMFVALLAAILSSQALRHDPPESLRKHELTLQLEELRQTKAELVSSLSEVNRQEARPEQPDHPALVEWRRLKALRLESEVRLEEVQEKLAHTNDEHEQMQHRSSILLGLRQEITVLERTADSLYAVRAQPLRAPRLHTSEKRPFWLIVENGALYPCFAIRSLGRFEPHRSVATTSVGHGTEYRSIEGRGQHLEHDFQNKSFCREILKTLPAATYSLHFAVHQDSFEAFLQFREVFLTAGYSYNWSPIAEGEILTLYSVSSVQDQ